MTIKNLLKPLINGRDITVYRLSRLTGLPQNTLYRIANDPNVYPDSHVVDALCNALECQIGDLLLQTRDTKEMLTTIARNTPMPNYNMPKGERFVCTPENPWTPEKGDRSTHPSAECYDQDDGWPSGDIAYYQCPICKAKWKEELPQ
jgi:DNA-binding Xre family transcriptional regulator